MACAEKHTPGVARWRDRWVPDRALRVTREKQKIFTFQPEGPGRPRPGTRYGLIKDSSCSMPRLRLVLGRLSTVPEHVVELHRRHSRQKAAQELDRVQSTGANLALLN